MAAQFHLAEHAFTLKLLLERLQRLIDIVVANENLHLAWHSIGLRRYYKRGKAAPKERSREKAAGTGA